ncbi:MAG: hypothetical protein KGQ36_01780 [Rickettsiales bacterium]|nr:hypothetical protein [Rickettsiales bacterium]
MRSTISLERESIKKNFFRRVRSKKIGVQEISQLVEENNWLVGEVDRSGNNALHYAALSGNMDKVNYFLGERVNLIHSGESGIATIITIKMPDSISPIDSLALNSSGHNAIHYFNCEGVDADFEYKKKIKKSKNIESVAIIADGKGSSEEGSYFPKISGPGPKPATPVSAEVKNVGVKFPSITGK